MALSKIDVANMLTGVTPVANGGTALSSGTSGQFLKFTGSTTLASASSGGITQADMFVLETQYNSATSGNVTFTNQFVRISSDNPGRIGTGISLDTSNGKYTFSETGIYQVHVTCGASARDGADNEAHFNLMINGSEINYIYIGANTGDNDVSNTGSAPYLVDITSSGSSGDYIQLKCGGDGVIYHGAGNATYHACSITFVRLGDT